MVNVRSYTKKDGTRVKSHTRSIKPSGVPQRKVTSPTQYYISGVPMKSQIITTENSYTIETKHGTLYSSLPPNYKLKGRVVSVKDSFYQDDDYAKEITMERFSKNPKGWNLRKRYLLWYSRGRIVK